MRGQIDRAALVAKVITALDRGDLPAAPDGLPSSNDTPPHRGRGRLSAFRLAENDPGRPEHLVPGRERAAGPPGTRGRGTVPIETEAIGPP